ncbi:MAG TPA: hypothetical protein VG796_31395 [Verrucomicrobiales bacterium]|nr:hypothetical protein [Verrucomicrobiales bacterium]
MPRTGKISRFPSALRDEVNLRLDRNEPGRDIANWLNTLPEVKEALRGAPFDGKPINEQNISEWRQGGFVEWQLRNDLFARLDDLSSLDDEIQNRTPAIADRAARLLTTHLALLISELVHPTPTHTPTLTPLKKSQKGPRNCIPPHQPEPPSAPAASSIHDSTIHDSRFSSPKNLLSLTRALCAIRRSDQSAARLKMEQSNFDRANADDDDSESPGVRLLEEALRRLAYGAPPDNDNDNEPAHAPQAPRNASDPNGEACGQRQPAAAVVCGSPAAGVTLPSAAGSPPPPNPSAPSLKSGKIRQNQTSEIPTASLTPTHTLTPTFTLSEPASEPSIPAASEPPPPSNPAATPTTPLDSTIHNSTIHESLTPPPTPTTPLDSTIHDSTIHDSRTPTYAELLAIRNMPEPGDPIPTPPPVPITSSGLPYHEIIARQEYHTFPAPPPRPRKSIIPWRY